MGGAHAIPEPWPECRPWADDRYVSSRRGTAVQWHFLLRRCMVTVRTSAARRISLYGQGIKPGGSSQLYLLEGKRKEGYLRQGMPSDACEKPDTKKRACLVPLDTTQITEDTNVMRYVRLSRVAHPYTQPRCQAITTEMLEIGGRFVLGAAGLRGLSQSCDPGLSVLCGLRRVACCNIRGRSRTWCSCSLHSAVVGAQSILNLTMFMYSSIFRFWRGCLVQQLNSSHVLLNNFVRHPLSADNQLSGDDQYEKQPNHR